MEATSDDPPKSHDQSGDVERDNTVDALPPSKELGNQGEDIAYNDLSVQDEIQSGESGTDKSHTESKASEKSPCKLQQGAIFSGKILSFCCLECKGDTTYSPNDLLKHFQGAHKGTLPTYPCDLCTFVTNEFSSLQRHRIGHRDTLVTCEICNDGVQYSLLLLTRHFIMCHSCNGLFRCKKCEFSTRDAGTFVQHIHHHNEGNHKCVKCPPTSPTQGKVHSGKVQSGTFPFTCQLCGYGAARREYLSKHMTVAHGDEMDRTNRWRLIEDNSRVNSPGLKLLLKKSLPAGGSREPQWMSKLNSYPGVGLLDHSGRLFNPEKTLEETQQFLERAVGVKKESNKWSRSPLKCEPQCSNPPVTSTTPQPKIQENELGAGSGILDPGNSNGLTVLMVKNKISIPPNCTTKVMGFKMVDGKKHLVLKVIPTKQEPTTNNDMSPTNNVDDDDEKTGSSPYSSLSERSGSLLSLDSGTNKDVSALLKIETHNAENHIADHSSLLEDHEANVEPTLNKADDEVLEISGESVTNSSASHCADLSTISREVHFSENQYSGSNLEKKSLHDHEHCTRQTRASNSTSKSPEISHTDQTKTKAAPLEMLAKHRTELEPCTDDLSSLESAAGERSLPELTVSANDATPLSVVDEFTTPPAVIEYPCNLVAGKNLESFEDHGAEQISPKIPSPTLAAEKRETPVCEECETSLCENTAIPAPCPNLLIGETSRPSSVTDSSPRKDFSENASDSNISPLNKTSANNSPDAKDGVTEVNTSLQNSPNQEVFSFHNYSKETFGSSPDFLDADEHSQEDLEEDECEEDFDELKLASDWSLTLPASPPLVDEQSEEYVGSGEESSVCVNDAPSASENKSLERVSDSDIEVDECVATVEDLPLPATSETDKGACSEESEKKEGNFMSSVVEGGPATLKNAAVLGKILEEHSDAIISQQLEKERMVSSSVLQDTNRPTKTTLRILQMPEGKKQMFLQTMEAPYAVPVQLTGGQGFKLITKSCASKVNVSYVKPGIEMTSKGSGLSLTLNGGRIGMSAQSLSGEGKGHSSLLQTVSSNGGRYFVNASALKGPLLLSGTVKAPSEQAVNMQPTCYLVQRPLPVSPSTESTGSTSKTVLTTRPVLAMPVKSADKAAALRTGRQAYLVRYISPAKSGILVNSSNENGAKQGSQANEGSKSRLFLKVVRGPNGARFLSTAPYTSAKKPLYVATSSLQSPYFLMSSEWTAGLKTCNSAHSPTRKLISAKLKDILPKSDSHHQNQVEGGLVEQNSSFLQIHTRPRSQRKRRRRMMFEESFEISSKIRRMSSKAFALKEVSPFCKPVAKDVERTLRLSPFSPFQRIKCPRQNQPVVVLNHPDADIPEVTNIMKSVNRYKGEVIKVELSENTVRALSEWNFIGPDNTLSNTPGISTGSRVRPSGNKVRERFILRLKLKKTRRNKYEVVKLSSSTGSEQISTFSCWFCGRVFNNQEEWIGHGQRHLMEATRDWNKLF